MTQIFEEKVLPYNLRCSDKLQLPKGNQLVLKLTQLDLLKEKYGRHYHQN